MTEGPDSEGGAPRGGTRPARGADRAPGVAARFDALGRIRRRAALATLVWTVLVAAYAIGFFGTSSARGTAFLDGAFFLVAWALPVILIWLAAFLAEELARLRATVAALGADAGPLAAALEATRASLDRHPAAPRPPEPGRAEEVSAAVGTALERLVTGQAEILAGLATLRAAPAAPPAPRPPRPAAPAQTRGAPPPRAPAAAPTTEADLAPAPAPRAEPEIAWPDIVRAFDFPKDAEDAEGFRALETALRRPSFAQMLQAAEDVLTILSQEDVYMDDLAAAPAEADAWRRLLAGGRGEVLAGLGGVTDAAALETTRTLMKEDTVFRDTALFFLRRFDTVLREIAPGASDAEIAQIADTRSGRAFQLVARASGAFD